MSSTPQPSPSKAAAMTTSPLLKVAVVETKAHMRHLIDLLVVGYLPTNPVSLYLNLEVPELHKRKSLINRLVLFVAPRSTVYVIDMLDLEVAFSTHGSQGGRHQTLKSILESVHVPKAVFDARKVCAALSRLQDIDKTDEHAAIPSIAMRNIHDVQLMELATRESTKSKQYLASWDECILTAGDGSVTSACELPTYQPVPLLFDPRLLQLPVLWANYHAKLTEPGGEMAFWMHMVRKAIKDRMEPRHTSLMNYEDDEDNDEDKHYEDDKEDEDDDILGPWTESQISAERDSWNLSMYLKQGHSDQWQWKAL